MICARWVTVATVAKVETTKATTRVGCATEVDVVSNGNELTVHNVQYLLRDFRGDWGNVWTSNWDLCEKIQSILQHSKIIVYKLA